MLPIILKTNDIYNHFFAFLFASSSQLLQAKSKTIAKGTDTWLARLQNSIELRS